MSRSTGTPEASVTSSSRQASMLSRIFFGGYHLKGMATISASCPCERKACCKPSARPSAPPRTNGTWVVAIRILIRVKGGSVTAGGGQLGGFVYNATFHDE